jgi:subtilisin family serine protease
MATPADTLFSTQWHLHNSTPGQFDLNVLAVWNAYTGAGVKVMVLDNGFDHAHEDLVANYNLSADRDYFDLDDDAGPSDGDGDHGTATMGLIGAARNGVGVVGVAYGATMIGARMGFPADADRYSTQIVSALGDAVSNNIDVVNMSFGGGSDYDGYFGADNVARIQAAFEDAVADGRGGLGLALVKAAGNERASFIDVNHTQPDSDTRQIIVAAVNRDGFVSDYSSYGAPILVSAFGSPLSGEIVTTDLTGATGYSSGDYASNFNGTSAAAPQVAGVVALMLDANADLGWRDIQTILAVSARHVGSPVNALPQGNELNAWQWIGGESWNGGGMHYSPDYGYGLVDALAAVRLAESWSLQSTSANQAKSSLDLLDGSVTLPDGDTGGTSVSGDIAADLLVERVVVTMKLALDFAEDFSCVVIGPDGREQELIADAGGTAAVSGTYSFHAQGFRGAPSTGSWSVRLIDQSSGDACTVSDVKLSLFGARAGKNDTYWYTNEFSDFVANHSKALADKDGGVDLLNAAAVSSASTLDLATGKGRIDGVAVTIKGIEDILAATAPTG